MSKNLASKAEMSGDSGFVPHLNIGGDSGFAPLLNVGFQMKPECILWRPDIRKLPFEESEVGSAPLSCKVLAWRQSGDKGDKDCHYAVCSAPYRSQQPA